VTRAHDSAAKKDPERARAFAVEAARLLADRKCTDVILLDVRGHSQVCDFVAIGSGTSQRQMRSVAQELEELGASMGMHVYRSSRDEGTTWIVADFVDVVVHLFEPDQRLYYDLELLWANGAKVEWKRPPDAKPASGIPAN
jgi:ribosome-associated protein